MASAPPLLAFLCGKCRCRSRRRRLGRRGRLMKASEIDGCECWLNVCEGFWPGTRLWLEPQRKSLATVQAESSSAFGPLKSLVAVAICALI